MPFCFKRSVGALLITCPLMSFPLQADPGVSCVKPKGALYLFPKLDPEVYPIKNDEKFALDLLQQQKVLIVQGSGFNMPDTQHFRIVFLPRQDEVEDAISRIATFLKTYEQ
jgi:alanine-synthesizing transaminase